MRQGRFEKDLHEAMRRLNASIHFDRRLHAEDIRGSLAWAAALARAGTITPDEEKRIREGLEEIEREIESGTFPFSEELEDIHMNIEGRLTEKIGAAGEKLHTGRSRNDQVATDFRLHVKAAATAAIGGIEHLLRSLVGVAEREFGVVIPAYTHLQRAQPVLLSHHLLAYAEMLDRDRARFEHARDAADVCPLGSGACAGNQFGIDREFLRERLGFRTLTRNSMDGVSDRDFAVDYLYAASLLMVHLSRLSEDLILWSSSEFGLVRLDDSVSTGSSMLPQKRNADAAELARGKCGRVLGHLHGLLVTLKGLPLTYNKDLQEDKESVFDVEDSLELVLPVFAEMVATLEVDRRRAGESLEGGFLEAMAIADYLTRRGTPFREAHRIAGQAVLAAERKGVTLAELSPEEYRALSPLLGKDLVGCLTAAEAVADKTVVGGTAPERVREEIRRWKEGLS